MGLLSLLSTETLFPSHAVLLRTFVPFNALPPPRTTLRPPAKAANCLSISALRSIRVLSTRFRRSISPSTVIPDRFTFAIVISGEKTELSVKLCEQSNSKSLGLRNFWSYIFSAGVFVAWGWGPWSPWAGGGHPMAYGYPFQYASPRRRAIAPKAKRKKTNALQH